ncbi:hypothetical protein [Streptomyces sp. CC208A]|uniref:hypothetical protein n=1 Tax=Streptomyces sp. CC208A TaxID=3044573 RepID=UPI0024A940F1|nr:hypothetical protein [Streptomyces sp. CC208A]
MTSGPAGTAVLLAAAPAGRGRTMDAASVLPALAAVPPGVLTGTATATLVELADPIDPQAVLTRLRAAAQSPGPLVLYLAGQLHLDRRQQLPHLALARSTSAALRYTALPWHWLAEAAAARPAGTTTVVADLVADPETWTRLGTGTDLLRLTPSPALYARVTAPPRRGEHAAPDYLRAWADQWRAGARLPFPALHAEAATRTQSPQALFLTPTTHPTAPAPQPPAQVPAPAPVPASAHAPAPAQLPALAQTSTPARAPAPAQAPAPGPAQLPAPAPAHPPVPAPVPGPAPVPVPVSGPAPVRAEQPAPVGVPPLPAGFAAAPPVPAAPPAPADPELRREPVPIPEDPEVSPGAMKSVPPKREGEEPAAHDPHPAILSAAMAGRHAEAAEMAAAWERDALRRFGPRSEEAVHWMEVRADLARLADEPARSCELWLAVAEARLGLRQRPDDRDVEGAVDRAHHQWEQITDPARARALGPALVSLRRRVPGRRPGALEALRRRMHAR